MSESKSSWQKRKGLLRIQSGLRSVFAIPSRCFNYVSTLFRSPVITFTNWFGRFRRRGEGLVRPVAASNTMAHHPVSMTWTIAIFPMFHAVTDLDKTNLAFVRLFQRNGSVTMWESRLGWAPNTRILIVIGIVGAWPSEKKCRRRQESGETNCPYTISAPPAELVHEDGPV